METQLKAIFERLKISVTSREVKLVQGIVEHCKSEGVSAYKAALHILTEIDQEAAHVVLELKQSLIEHGFLKS